MYVLFLLTVALLFGVGLVFAQTDRQAVMAHWDTRRCDLSVILGSHLYKPADDKRSATAFATENLKFCTNKIIEEVMTKAMNPFLALLGQQFEFLGVIQEVIANVKGMIAKFFRSFSRIFGGVYQRFIAIGFNFRKTFVLFMTAMNRVFGMTIASLYSGMSILVTVQNLVDAVLKIIFIVLAVFLGIVIILFLAFFPVIPVILTTVSVLVAGAAAGVASAGGAEGMASVFCFAPKTMIQTGRGAITMEDLVLGDILADGGCIEGILRVNGSATDIYTIKGVHVSGDHLVFYEPLAKWILVKEHPEARLEIKREPVLICLNTSTREIPLSGLRFRDWEEIPAGDHETQVAWNTLISEMLGSTSKTEADEYPLLSGAWFVQTPEGKVALRDIQMGTKILDQNNTWTKVLGIYEGKETIQSGSNTFWHTDSIWWDSSGMWTQKPNCGEKLHAQTGFHLVTGSGTFKLFTLTDEHLVRDFTEVGQMRIAETYEWMKQRL